MALDEVGERGCRCRFDGHELALESLGEFALVCSVFAAPMTAGDIACSVKPSDPPCLGLPNRHAVMDVGYSMSGW
jgi:hypothetical protein